MIDSRLIPLMYTAIVESTNYCRVPLVHVYPKFSDIAGYIYTYFQMYIYFYICTNIIIEILYHPKDTNQNHLNGLKQSPSSRTSLQPEGLWLKDLSVETSRPGALRH